MKLKKMCAVMMLMATLGPLASAPALDDHAVLPAFLKFYPHTLRRRRQLQFGIGDEDAAPHDHRAGKSPAQRLAPAHL